SLAAVLLIMSLGLAVTFGLMGIINMAHGEMLMLGSYTAYVVQEIFAARFPAYADSYFFVALPLAFLVAGLVGFALEWGVIWLLRCRREAGLDARAVMQSRAMAACLGVSTRRVDAVTFALGTALAGVAGCALALIGTVDPEVGKTYIVDSFMVVVLGGVGKLIGMVVASFCIGLSNKLIEPAIGGTAAVAYVQVAVLLLVSW